MKEIPYTPIGETFVYDKVILEVRSDNGYFACDSCFFTDEDCDVKKKRCSGKQRADKNNVHYVCIKTNIV